MTIFIILMEDKNNIYENNLKTMDADISGVIDMQVWPRSFNKQTFIDKFYLERPINLNIPLWL